MGLPTDTDFGMPALEQENIVSCSYCGKEETEVFALIKGPLCHVCDECVELMVEMIRELKPDFCTTFPTGN